LCWITHHAQPGSALRAFELGTSDGTSAGRSLGAVEVGSRGAHASSLTIANCDLVIEELGLLAGWGLRSMA